MINLEEVMVTSREGVKQGEESAAMLAVCECGCITFIVFQLVTRAGHLHLQCTGCGVTVCDGGCEATH
jgi:hypothetical protein